MPFLARSGLAPFHLKKRERERERESGFSVRIFRSHSYSCVGNSLPVGTAAGGRASPSSRTGFSLGYSVYTRGPLASNFRQRLFVARRREGGRRVSRTDPAFESRFLSKRRGNTLSKSVG